MYSIQSQYDTIPDQYVGKKSFRTVISNIRKIARDLIHCLDKAITAARVAENNPEDYQKVWRILTDE